MSFLRKRTNKLNNFFFQKFQEQVSQASGFSPLFTMEDFQKLIDEQKKLESEETENVKDS